MCPWPAAIHLFILLCSNISITIDLRWLLWHSCQSQLVYGLAPSIDTDPREGWGGGVSIDRPDMIYQQDCKQTSTRGQDVHRTEGS